MRFSDGAEVSLNRNILRPFAGGDDWIAPLREVTDQWPPPAGELVTLRVEYSDAQGAGRHELTLAAQVTSDAADYDESATTKRRIK
jgi:hypothetical protein